jgi:hypothetical protein
MMADATIAGGRLGPMPEWRVWAFGAFTGRLAADAR